MGLSHRAAQLKRGLVRTGFDLYREFEIRVSSPGDVPPRSFRGGRLHRDVQVRAPLLALTFDDGPHPENTPRLLEILAERGIRATFYLIGEFVARHPAIAHRIREERHELGNHTWSHRFLTTQTWRSVVDEIARTDQAVEEATGSIPLSIRPPYGATTTALARRMAHRFQRPTVLWSLSARDWEGPAADTITERLTAGARPGSIILNHDPVDSTIEAMPQTLDRLLAEGFEFVTVGDLMSNDASLGDA